MIDELFNMAQVTLDEIFNPRGVAIVGASPGNEFTFAAWVVAALKEAGFPGIYPVNPKYNEAFGLPCYPSVSSIPGVVDHVVVCIPADKSLELLDDCARKGVKSVHFFTAGFSESGQKERAELERAMLQKARAGGLRIIGPNCVGLFVPRAKLTNVTRMPLEPGPVAFISQSGGHALDMPLHAGSRGLRFSKVVSYGNALDIDECELLEYFLGDPETKIIAAYIEGVRDGKRFRSILEKTAKKKPVVMYKGGVTDAGLRAALSHTASMTSSVKVFQASCRQLNTIQVNDIQEMIDVLVALNFSPPYPVGRGIVVVGVGGGPSVQASDQIEAAGLDLPQLSKGVQKELSKFLLIAGAIFANPLDATNLIFPDVIYKTMKVLGEVPEIHILMYHMGFHPVSRWGGGLFSNDFFLKPAVEALHKAKTETGKPVIIVLGQASDMVGTEEQLKVQEAFVRGGLPVFHSLEKAAIGMARVEAWYRRFAVSDI